MSFSHIGSGKLILVVDDTPMLRELAELYLSRVGHVVSVSSGAEALDFVHETTPDLVVSDLGMPEMDGVELCRRLKTDLSTQDVPVVIVSASHDSLDRSRAMHAGAADYIVKPLERDVLLNAVRRFLHSRIPRGLPRIDLETWATLRLSDIEWTGRVRNLSRGGLFVESARALEPSSEVMVQLELPDSEDSVLSTAEVRWVRRERNESLGMGMRFLALDRDSEKSLARYVGERVSLLSERGEMAHHG